MGVLYSIGNTLVEPFELQEKAALGSLRTFAEAVREGRESTVDLSAGSVSSIEMMDAAGDPLGFEPVGLNKPLTIELVAAYTGNAPGRSFFDRVVGRGKPDLLIVSGTRTPQTFGAVPRAINQVVKDIDDRTSYRPIAFGEGSPIVYHSPAMVNATTFVSVEMVADSFSGEVFDQLGSLFTTASGLPVFAPAASYLLAGSVIAKIGKKLAGALLETRPFLRANEDIRFDSAGFPMEMARFMVFAADNDLRSLKEYSPRVVEQAGNARVVLAHRQSGDEYAGDVPFIVASLDGRVRREYAEFQPTHASAAIMDQFYGPDTLAGVAGVISESMTLYNDLKFRRAAERLRTERDALAADSPEREAADERLRAYLENIRTDELKSGLGDG